MTDIHALYKKAGELHGHYCPGLAIGVRAAVEALALLQVEDLSSKGLYCIAENRACYIDGIQMLFGTTLGKGNIEIRPRGKAAFNFYDRNAGKSVRLLYMGGKEGASREEMTEYILNAPLEALFAVGETVLQTPEDKYVPVPSHPCARCGEETLATFLTVVDGESLCRDCVGGE